MYKTSCCDWSIPVFGSDIAMSLEHSGLMLDWSAISSNNGSLAVTFQLRSIIFKL